MTRSRKDATLANQGKAPNLPEPASYDRLRESDAWSQFKANWRGIKPVSERWGRPRRRNSRQVDGPQELDDLERWIAGKKRDNRPLLAELVRARLLTRKAADLLNAIYADRLYHTWRPAVALCYAPTMFGGMVENTRADVEKRVRLLRRLSKRGTLSEETLRRIEEALAKDWEMVLRSEEIWKKRADGPGDGDAGGEYFKREQELISFFLSEYGSSIRIDDRLEVRKHLPEVVRLIRLLEE